MISDEVPLLGICELEMNLVIQFGEIDGEPIVGTSERRYLLQAYGPG